MPYAAAQPKDAKPRLLPWMIPIVVFGCILAFVVGYLLREHTFYFWDDGLYFGRYQRMPVLAANGGTSGVFRVLTTDIADDYTNVPLFPLLPLRYIFGAVRIPFVLSIAILYAFPFLLLTVGYVSRLFGKSSRPLSVPETVLAAVSVMVIPQFWMPVLEGKPEVLGLLPAILLIRYLDRRPLREMGVLSVAGIGTALALMYLVERWYAYWIIGFILSVGILRAAEALRDPPGRRQAVGPDVAKLAGIAATVSGCLAAVLGGTLKARVFTDYADLYSAYRGSGFLSGSVTALAASYGWIFWLAVPATVVFLARRGWGRILAFHVLLLTIPIVLFSLVQTPSLHQQYLLYPSLVVLGACVSVELKRLCSGRVRPVVIPVFVAVSVLLFVRFYSGTFLRGVIWDAVFPSDTHPPQQRTDFGPMRQLYAGLDGEIRSAPGPIYTLASSGVINSSLLKNYCAQYAPAICPYLLDSSDVDKRDGLGGELFGASYVLVADPIQYHLHPADQQVIGVPAADILAGSGIGRAYDRIGVFGTFGDDVTVYVYRRARPFVRDDIVRLFARFRSAYPGHDAIFAMPDEELDAVTAQR